MVTKDISEKKKLEISLKDSEAKYRDLFENAQDPMYTLDMNGTFLAMNNVGLNALCATKDEVIGSNISEWLTPESMEIARNRLKEYADGIYMGPTVYEMVRKDDKHIWVEIKNRFIWDGGRITGTHGIARDVTEQKKMEQELKESEAKYRDLFENANDPMYTIDIAGFIKTMNKAGLEILGGTEENIIGSHISKWLTPESMKSSQSVLEKQISGETWEFPVPIEVISIDGTHKWGEARTRILKEGNIITGIHGVVRDITEKIKIEQRLLESEARYRDLFENADDPMYTIDMDGIFQSINNAGCKILEAKKEEIIGTHIVRWLTPESFESAKQRIKKNLSNVSIEEPVIYELVCNNGEHRWAEIRTRPIKEGNRITGIHGIGRDITEKIKLEQKLNDYRVKLEKSYEELLEADNVKTEFMSNVTHELLTPLTSIRGFVELLNDETMGKINAEQKKSLEIILRNSDRLIKLIKELLDTSNLENNKLGLQFGLVSLNSILSKTIQDIHPQANDKQITIIKHIQQLPEIWGDEERLVQVITNLLINAIKFTPHKGKITIKAKEDIEHIKIRISDTGIGIPADKLNSVFERFYQVDGSAKRKYGGVGLGLSICKSIIDKHYGKIWAESNGKGSTFYILLPKLEYKEGEYNV
ncbi:Methyl sulfide methyltransferase-associated sensor [uncultured archaeon]|nr:Methyl sulfide methyltransferase-associated sensor [uncultured archaeon]